MRDFLLVEAPRAGVHHSFEDAAPPPERWDEIAHPCAPTGGWPGDRAPHIPWINLVLVGSFLVAWGAAAPGAARGCWRIARSLTGGERARLDDLLLVPFVLLPPLATLAFGISNLKIDAHWPQRLGVAGYRYFLPLFLFGTILVAVVGDRALRGGRARRVGGVLLLAALFSASAWNLAWLRLGTAGVGQRYVGHNFVQAARGLFNDSIGLTHEERVAIAETLPPVFRAHLYRGLGLNESMRWVVTTSQAEGVPDFQVVRKRPYPIDELVARYPEHARAFVARGAGTGLRYYVGMRGQNDKNLKVVAAALQSLVESGSPWATLAIEGAATTKDFPDPWSETKRILPRSKRLLELLPPEQRPAFGIGLGEVCGGLYQRGIPEEEEFLKGFLNACVKIGGEEVLVGVGRGMALAGDRPALSATAREVIPDPYWQAVETGYDAGLAELATFPE